MREFVRSWVTSVVVYALALLAVGLLLGGLLERGGGAGASWVLLVVPPLLAVVAGVLVLRTRERPTWHAGVVVAMPVAVVAVVLAGYSAARAGDALPLGAAVAGGAVPLVVALLAGAGTGILAARLWVPPVADRPSYLPTGGSTA